MTTARATLNAAMTEAALMDAVTECACRFGWKFFHDADSRRNNAGFPDLVMVHVEQRRLLHVELKTERGRLRPEQTVWMGALGEIARECGTEVYVWRPSDWLSGRVERILEGKNPHSDAEIDRIEADN